VAEKFSTFVAYDKQVPPEIVKLTGITDEMLVGAPNIKDVIPDFYKFCDGCLLVGHNVTFDYRFVQHYGKKERYSFDQARYDTLTLGQELLHLSNYKLNTLADHYGVTFNHHRAFDDALATAKIFIQLLKTRKTLPAPSVDDGK
jgi:DNA polymerase-3 subunit alpha (Gram-positive type)